MRKSSAATTMPFFASVSLSTVSCRRSPLHQAPPCSSTRSGNGPVPRGLKRRASSGLSPWRTYSTSSTSIAEVAAALMAMIGSSGRPEHVGGGFLHHRALEEGRVDRAPEAHGVGEREVAEVVGGDEPVLVELVGLGQHLHHVRHVEVPDVGAEQRVESRAHRIHAAVECPGVDRVVGLAAVIEPGCLEFFDVSPALYPVRGLVVLLCDAAARRAGVWMAPDV